MQEFERATFHKESQEDRLDKAVFLFESLERGFGTTIGNAICRTMRSNLPGTGIVGFQIEGMEPGDTTISGLLEDTTALILNLKALMLTGDVDEESCITYEEQGSEKQPDYQDYAGLWSEGGSSHEEILRTGGAEFYAEITNNNELRGWMYVQQQRTERFAEMRDISCSIEDGHCRYAFVDDGFGNSGTVFLHPGL